MKAGEIFKKLEEKGWYFDADTKEVDGNAYMAFAEEYHQAKLKLLSMPDVSKRFKLFEFEVNDFAIISIHDNIEKKVVCHLVHDNGADYCREMAQKMLDGLNACQRYWYMNSEKLIYTNDDKSRRPSQTI